MRNQKTVKRPISGHSLAKRSSVAGAKKFSRQDGLGRLRKWGIHGLRLLIALAFIAAAIAKLAGIPELVAVYDKIGIGQWFRYMTVAVEVVGVVAVLTPRCTMLGALLLAATMFVAALTCIFILGSNPGPAFLLCGLCTLLAYLKRDDLFPMMKLFRH